MNGLQSYLRRVERQTVIVNLVSGTSVRGVLMAVYRDCIVLRHASAAPNGARELVDVDGEQAIPRGNVDWIQVLPTEEAS